MNRQWIAALMMILGVGCSPSVGEKAREASSVVRLNQHHPPREPGLSARKLTPDEARRLLPPSSAVLGLRRSDPDAGSDDLTRDLRLMWQTRLITGGQHASTPQAIDAASRVFNTLQLVGLTRREVLEKIGHPTRSSNSAYNCPFWPVPSDALVYRFDTGSQGWQFDVLFDDEGRVKAIQRRIIH